MTLKEYLHIQDDIFTISNEFIFINHHKGEEFVLNLKTKRKHTNPIILDRTNSLTRLLEIPIHDGYTQELYHNDKLVYHEKLTLEPPQSPYIGLSISKAHIGTIAGTLIYSIQKEDDGNYKHQRKENVGANMRPFGTSTECLQIRIRPMEMPNNDYIFRLMNMQYGYNDMIIGELTHRDNANDHRYLMGIDPIEPPVHRRERIAPIHHFIDYPERPLNGFYNEEIAARVTQDARDTMRELIQRYLNIEPEETETNTNQQLIVCTRQNK